MSCDEPQQQGALESMERTFPVEVHVADSIPDVFLGQGFLQATNVLENRCNTRFGERSRLEIAAEGARVDLGHGWKEEDASRSDEIPTGPRLNDLEVADCSTKTLPMCVRCGGKMSQLVDAHAASLKKPRSEAYGHVWHQLEATDQEVYNKEFAKKKFYYLWNGPHIT